MSAPAPFYCDVADGPDDVRALWVRAEDGVRLRLAFWPGGRRGTVLLFPGRSEYCEKYGRFAEDLQAIGLSTIAIDWRGQGLADRELQDRATGHVIEFADYQLDVAAMLDVARREGLPEPFFLLGHSMGGCIGLRSLMEGLPVQSAAFTGPMWGIRMRASLRPLAWGLSWAARQVGQGWRYAPTTGPFTYLETAAFAGNTLTTDPDMYSYMQRQLTRYPELGLGGPSLHWLFEALAELRALARRPSPDIPCVTFIGSNERIVDIGPVHRRMADWAGGRLEVIAGAEHEVLMETRQIRARILDVLQDLYLGRRRAA